MVYIDDKLSCLTRKLLTADQKKETFSRLELAIQECLDIIQNGKQKQKTTTTTTLSQAFN